MNIEQRILAFSKLGHYISEFPIVLQEVVHKTALHNPWFTTDNTHRALLNIAEKMLNKQNLIDWTVPYNFTENKPQKGIAVVAAGNIPMVAFQDILCILISGNRLHLKLSEKDNILLPFLLEQLIKIETAFSKSIQIQTKLENFDAIIATGSNASAKHFEYYFAKYPNIIRKNRNSVAILDGTEQENQLQQLGHDIFDYFGLGCRNVSKLYIPKNYDISILKEAFQSFSSIMQHTQYMNNLDYQRTIYLMNQIPIADIDFINIVENNSIPSPISCLHFERYNSLDDVENTLNNEKETIQCIIGKKYLEFGSSQQPGLTDYADGIDTLKFITELK